MKMNTLETEDILKILKKINGIDYHVIMTYIRWGNE